MPMSSASDTRTNTRRAAGGSSEDWYAILGVGYDATPVEIKRAYRASIKKIHPDRASPEDRQSAEDRARLVNQAYRVLSDPDSRKAHDVELKSNVIQDQIMSHYFGGMGMPGGRDPTSERIREAQLQRYRQSQRKNDRRATLSLLLAFTSILVVVLVGLLIWSVLDSVVGSAF